MRQLTSTRVAADHQDMGDTKLILFLAALAVLIFLARRYSLRLILTAAAVIFFASWLAWAGYVILVFLVALAALAITLISLRVSPRVAHRGGRCRSGRIYSLIFPKRFRLDPKCGGRGRVIHPLAARYGSDRIRAEAKADKEAAKAARRRGPWAE